MSSERQLEVEREQLKEAIDWIDKERQSLKRGAFNATRQKGSGRGFHITLMKKKSEWLFGQRNRIRDRLGEVNVTLKEMRRARSGKPSDSFATVFFRVAKSKLPEGTFEELRILAEDEFSKQGNSYVSRDEQDGETVLDVLKAELERFIEGCSPKLKAERPPRPEGYRGHRPQPEDSHGQKESQEDFGLHHVDSGGGIGRKFPCQTGRYGAGRKVVA